MSAEKDDGQRPLPEPHEAPADAGKVVPLRPRRRHTDEQPDDDPGPRAA